LCFSLIASVPQTCAINTKSRHRSRRQQRNHNATFSISNVRISSALVLQRCSFGSVLDVQSRPIQHQGCEVYPRLQYRCACSAVTTRHDFLFDLHCLETSQEPGGPGSAGRKGLMAEDNQLQIDIEKRTTRGRACPRCGGKIIPSDRAVYQSTGDPNDVFPVWQCERCGYEEVGEKRKPAGKAKH